MSAPPPAISIVIPSRDTKELTLACLASLGGAGPEREILLVDDGGRDGTAEAASALPGVTVLRSETSQGFTRSANRGLAAARGRLLFLLNSDTEVEPDALAEIERAFAADPTLGAAGAALSYPDGRPQWSGGGEPTGLWLFVLASGIAPLLGRLRFYRRLRPIGRSGEVAWVTGAALAIRREAFEQVGLLDEAFRFYAQDLDYCLRLRAAGWRVAILPGVRVRHHQGATIGTDPGASSGQHPELLWTDLLLWAGKHRGPSGRARARRALRAGAAFRALGRAAVRPFTRGSRRAAWMADDAAFEKARRALAAR
ncbi:MAG TPA: glycosyltransferase family 2 protein [Thermoanaerobaculia bacterium]|nr:glycosyltransferase family 2 protein [Thermoanaerobaculia bacterium]